MVSGGLPKKVLRGRASAGGPRRDEKGCEAYELHTDTDLLHGDLDGKPAATGSTIGACCALCSARSSEGCHGLTLTPGGECWLKQSVSELHVTKQRGLTSAILKAKHHELQQPERAAAAHVAEPHAAAIAAA